MKRVLITDDCHPSLTEGLERMGYACDFEPDITLAEVRARIGAYHGLIINSKILVDQPLLDAAAQLEFVGRMGSGMEIVDRVYAAKKNVAVLSSPEGNNNAVAEHALGMLLALSNNLLRADRELRRREWRREANRGVELRGRTLGIVGFGYTGSQLARKLAGFEMRVLAHDRYKTGFSKEMPWVEACDIEEIRREADIVSLHLPLTEETRHYVNRDFIAGCKPGFILINTARGQCVDTYALADALEAGQCGGACLDVFENEKPETYSPAEIALYHRLFALDQVILSPHIAGWTVESKKLLAEILVEKIAAVLAKKA
jgi:D-3-phosphoglycerate dehydrogenase